MIDYNGGFTGGILIKNSDYAIKKEKSKKKELKKPSDKKK